jgi:putative PIN family toxin of toxin-antitoxin system
MRVVLDTNVIVSAYLSSRGASAELIRRWLGRSFQVLVSVPVLAEYERALNYGRVRDRHGMTAREVARVVDRFREFGLFMEGYEEIVGVARDPADDKFLALAVAGGAGYIASGDPHLLDVGRYGEIDIVRPAALVAELDKMGT